MSSEGSEESDDRIFSDVTPELVKIGCGKHQYLQPGQ
jgi:hypothetical protein